MSCPSALDPLSRSAGARRCAWLAVAALFFGSPPALAHEPEDLEGLVPPALIADVAPVYPPKAEALGVEGDVELHVDIDERGEVFRVEVIAGAPPALSWTAMGAATQLRFEPALLRGEPVAVRVHHVMRFRLVKPPKEPRVVAPPPAADPQTLGLVVRERAPRRSASEERIERGEIRRANRRSGDDLLSLVPGLFVAQHGAEGKGQQLFLRGFDAGHGSDVEVTVDGFPLNEPSHVHGQGYLDLGFLIPEGVEGIDVYKGPHRLPQGAFATAGTAALRLGVPEDERGLDLRYELGNTNRHRLLALYAPVSQPAGTFVAAELLHDDGFGTARGSERASLLARLSLPFGDGEELFALASLYAASFGAPTALRQDDIEAGRVPLTGSYLDDTGGASLRGLLGAGYRGRVLRGALEARLFARARHLSLEENHTGFLQDLERGDRRLQQQSDGGLGAALDYERKVVGTLKGFGGLRWEGDVVRQAERALDDDAEPIADRRSLGFVQQRAAALAGLKWHGPGWLYVEGGLRLDLLSFAAEDQLSGEEGGGVRLVASPRVLAAVGPFAGFKVFGAYGRGFRPPEARAFTATSGEARSEPSVVDSGELGVEWRPTDGVRASLAGFAMYVEHEVLFDPLAGANLAVDASSRLGAEASATVDVARWLKVGGDLTAADARFLRSRQPVPGAPPLLASLRTALVHDGAYLGARWLVLGARPLAYGAQAAPAVVLDLSAGYDLGVISLDLAIDNALDVEWAEAAYAYASRWDRSASRSRLPTVHVVAGSPRLVRLGLTAHF